MEFIGHSGSIFVWRSLEWSTVAGGKDGGISFRISPRDEFFTCFYFSG